MKPPAQKHREPGTLAARSALATRSLPARSWAGRVNPPRRFKTSRYRKGLSTLLDFPNAHTITEHDLEDAYILGFYRAAQHIETYGRMNRDFIRSLVRPDFVPDPFDGRTILSGGRGAYRVTNGNGYHPRRGNGPLFARYEALLNKVGLSVNMATGAVQHIVVPADDPNPPLQRNPAERLAAEKTFGVSDLRSIPITIHAREIPDWTLDDAKVGEFLKHRCPSAFRKANPRSQRRAHRKVAELCAVLYLWFRVLLTAEQIAEELGIETGHVIRVASDAREHYPLFIAGTCGCFRRGTRRTS